jgi:DNA-binding transcriptional regulator YdaS (Cro superfamily)
MDTRSTERDALKRAADVLGGQAALASACGFNHRRNVWPWFNVEGRRVPADKCPAIERATKARADAAGDPSLLVTCEQLRPDVPWDVLREQVAA